MALRLYLPWKFRFSDEENVISRVLWNFDVVIIVRTDQDRAGRLCNSRQMMTMIDVEFLFVNWCL